MVLWAASLPPYRCVSGLLSLSELGYGCSVTLQMLAGLFREYAHTLEPLYWGTQRFQELAQLVTRLTHWMQIRLCSAFTVTAHF